MQANFIGRLGARKRNSREDSDEDETPACKVNDLQSSTHKKNVHQENAVLASRLEAWERVDPTMQEAATGGAESDVEDVSAMLASIGCGSILPHTADEDVARAQKERNLTAMLVSLGCGKVLARSILPHTGEGDSMTLLAQLSQEKIARLCQEAAVAMAATIVEGVKAWTAGTNAVKEADASGKFFDAKYGSRELFHTGLEGYVGLPEVQVYEAMMREHTSTEQFTPSNNTGSPPCLPSP